MADAFMTGVLTESWFPADDGTQLFMRRWTPGYGKKETPKGGPPKPRGLLHIVHGMAEHGGRYDLAARRLCERGIEVWAADMRGHGKTADPGVNDPGKGGLLGHCGDRNAVETIARDIHRINMVIRESHPDIPLFILGHSWGSFLVQFYIEAYNLDLAGCVLSGTRGPGGLKVVLGAPLMGLIAAVKGSRRASKLAFWVADGPYNRPFRPKRTPYDWLSRDEREVDKFIEDPLCGTLSSSGFYRDMIGMLYRIHQPKRMGRIPKELPIYIFSGNSDPVGEMGVSPTALLGAYKSLKIKDLEFVLYPGARHETLNETNREEVIGDLGVWIEKHCSVKKKSPAS